MQRVADLSTLLREVVLTPEQQTLVDEVYLSLEESGHWPFTRQFISSLFKKHQLQLSVAATGIERLVHGREDTERERVHLTLPGLAFVRHDNAARDVAMFISLLRFLGNQRVDHADKQHVTGAEVAKALELDRASMERLGVLCGATFILFGTWSGEIEHPDGYSFKLAESFLAFANARGIDDILRWLYTDGLPTYEFGRLSAPSRATRKAKVAIEAFDASGGDRGAVPETGPTRLESFIDALVNNPGSDYDVAVAKLTAGALRIAALLHGPASPQIQQIRDVTTVRKSKQLQVLQGILSAYKEEIVHGLAPVVLPAPNVPASEYMSLALEEARKCKAEDDRNPPMVGVVIVSSDGRLLASAHRGELRPGDHAEYTALEKKLAGESLVDATIYTTLEPCTERSPNKTPCVERLIERRVKRVFIAMLDPNHDIQGHGERRLREAGIDVGRFEQPFTAQIEELNRDFVRTQRVRAATRARVSQSSPSPDLGAQRERALLLRKLEAEARILGRLISNARNLGANDLEITLQIENLGRSGFSFDTCEWRVEWNHRFQEQLAKYNVVMPEGYVPPRGRLPVNANPLLPPGRTMDFRFKWTRLEAIAHFRDAKLKVPGFNGAWADYHFEVVCRGELGGEEILRWTERPTTP